MTACAHLWAIGYDDMKRAERVRDTVVGVGERRCLTVFDTAVAVRYPDGSLTLDGEPFVVATTIVGNSIAAFLARLALGAPPLTEAAVGALVRGTSCASAGVAIDENFVNEAQALMRPGTSVLFVLDQVCDMEATLPAIRGLGGTVLKTDVDLERARLIQSVLADASTATVEPGRR